MEAAAGLRFQSLYGEAPSAWKISADWNATEPFFAAAMSRALLACLLYTSPSPRDRQKSRMPSSA